MSISKPLWTFASVLILIYDSKDQWLKKERSVLKDSAYTKLINNTTRLHERYTIS